MAIFNMKYLKENVIDIHKSPNADSRTATQDFVSFEDFSRATDMHREDVRKMMYELARLMMEAGKKHDWTKKEKEEEFYQSFMSAKEQGKDFKKDDWYKYHVGNERHHLASKVPEDVNLIDVLEMISDCCMAGMARSGEVKEVTIDDNILKRAFSNTVELVKNSINLIDEEDDR